MGPVFGPPITGRVATMCHLRSVTVSALVACLLAAVVPFGSATAQEPAEPIDPNDPIGPIEPPATDPPPPTVPPREASPATIGDERVSPDLLRVRASSPEYDRALSGFTAILDRLEQAEATHESAVSALVELDALHTRLDGQAGTAAQRRDAARLELDELRAEVEVLAVEAYISGGTDIAPAADFDWQNATLRASRQTMVETVTEHDLAEITHYVETEARATRDYDRTMLLSESVSARRDEAVLVRDTAAASTVQLTADLEAAATTVADTRLAAWVQGADFQFVALNAYYKAAAALEVDAPSCGIRWEMIAGIARVESGHGTYRGSSIAGDGRVTEQIIGIALDGSRGTASVRDSDGGYYDGDTVHDRAVGPMQFLPSSWLIFGDDGNRDRIADPHNIYDAALAAARLLCWNGYRLDTDEGLEAALFGYNRSTEYVEIVRRHIDGYTALELPRL